MFYRALLRIFSEVDLRSEERELDLDFCRLWPCLKIFMLSQR